VLSYAFDAGPAHRWEAGRTEILVDDLAGREDIVPRVNLARWTSLAPAIQERLGPDDPDTLSTRSYIAYWTGEAGDAAGALRLFSELLPDWERVLGPDHPDTLTTPG
jgi:Tetratricopeptide repeat